MSRPGVAVLVLGLASTGCAATASPDTTTTTAVSVASVSEPTKSSSTAPDDAPVDLCDGFETWDTDTAHVARCFLAPVAFTPRVDGWWSTLANLDALEGGWTDVDEAQPSIRFVILAYLPELSPSEIIDSILAIDGVHAIRDSQQESGTRWADIETDPVLMTMPNLERIECARDASLDLIAAGGEPGYTLLDRVSLGTSDGGRLYGLGACRTFRIWAIPISGITVTAVATTDDLDRFDELMPIMDQLVASITVATP